MPKLLKVPGSPYWYVEGRDANGIRYRQSTKQRDRAAASRVARAIELERALPGVKPYSLGEAFEALVAYKRLKQVSDAEFEIVRDKSARVLEHFGARFDTTTLTAKHIEGYIAARRTPRVVPDRGGTPKAVSDATIRKEIAKLFEALRLAKRDGHFPHDPDSLRTTVLKADQPRKRFLSEDEFIALYNEIPEARRDWLVVFVHTGVRYAELHRIEAKHVDHVNRRLWVIGHKGTKQYSERWVPLSDEAYEILARRSEQHPHGAVFPKPWMSCNLNQTMKRACDRLGIPRCSANDLRRTFVTWHGRYGTPDVETKKFLGHSPQSRLVDSVYRQLHLDSGRDATNAFPTGRRPKDMATESS